MKTKIKTPFGYLCLPDESTVENATTTFNETNSHREINMIDITSDDAKRLIESQIHMVSAIRTIMIVFSLQKKLFKN